MPGGEAALLLVKSLALASVDCASVFIAFAAAPGFHIGNFPWALLNLLVVLVFADTTVLLYPYLKRRYGASYARGWCLATGGYYLLTMVLTPLFYWRTPGPLFTAMVGGALALYAAAVAAILLTRNKRRRRRDTQVNGGVIALSMLELGGSVHELQSLLPPRQWEGLNKAYVALRTCWEFAAPFGRSDMPVVLELEAAIASRVSAASHRVQALCAAFSEPDFQAAVHELLEIAELLKSREKQLLS